MLRCKFVLKYVYILLGILGLLSCQVNSVTVDGTPKAQQQLLAAKYNTQLGLAYLSQGDRVRAKNKLIKAIQEAPQSAEANSALAYYMEKSGELNQAEAYYLKAIKLSPDGAALNNFGAFLCRRGQYTQAEKYFLKAVKDEHYTHTAGAYENAGLCIMQQDPKKAAVYFKKALAHDPSRRESLRELVRIKNNLINFRNTGV